MGRADGCGLFAMEEVCLTGFAFFQKFLKDNGILDMLEELGIEEGDTVKLYGLEFDYYK